MQLFDDGSGGSRTRVMTPGTTSEKCRDTKVETREDFPTPSDGMPRRQEQLYQQRTRYITNMNVRTQIHRKNVPNHQKEFRGSFSCLQPSLSRHSPSPTTRRVKLLGEFFRRSPAIEPPPASPIPAMLQCDGVRFAYGRNSSAGFGVRISRCHKMWQVPRVPAGP